MRLQKELPVLLSCVGLVLLLMSLYLRSQSSKFVDSTIAIRDSLMVDVVKNANSIADVKEWLSALPRSVSPDSAYSIDINCNASSRVDVACENVDLIRKEFSSKHVTVANGYHELIQLSLFAKFGEFPVFPDNNMFPSSASALSHVKTPVDFDGSLDPRLVNMLTPSEGSLSACVLIDGFAGKYGSSLKWNGTLLRGVYAFSNESESYLFYNMSWHTLLPCFSYVYNSSSDSDVLIFGRGHPQSGEYVDSTLNIAENSIWSIFITTGHHVRRKCIEYTTKLTPQTRFLAGASRNWADAVGLNVSIESVSDMLDLFFGCSALINEGVTYEELDSKFVTDLDLSRVKLGDAFGNFFDCQNEFLWQVESNLLLMKLDILNSIDAVRRSIQMYATMRNVQKDRLFYSLVSIEITFSSSGKLNTNFEIAFAPIMQYYYGAHNYPLVFVNWLVADIALGILIIGISCRILWMPKSMLVANHKQPLIPQTNAPTLTVEHLRTSPGDNIDNELYLSSCENSENGSVMTYQARDDAYGTNTADSPQLLRTRHAFFEFVLTCFLEVLLFSYSFSTLAALFAYADLHDYIVSTPQDFGFDYNRSSAYIAAIVERMDTILWHERTVLLTAFFVMVAYVIVFFLGLGKSRRFNVVTRTIYRSVGEVWPTLFVLLTAMLSYAVLGTTLYGKTKGGWSQLYGSFSNLFIMMLGEFTPYFEIKINGGYLTAIYILSFIVLMLFVVLNISLAIILRIYEEVNTETTAYYRMKREIKDK